MSMICETAKIAPKTAFSALGCCDTLENALQSILPQNLPPREQLAMGARLTVRLWQKVTGLVSEFNRVAGEDVLYLIEYVGLWCLYGRPSEEAVDKLLLSGTKNIDDLVRLAVRLQEGMEVLV